MNKIFLHGSIKFFSSCVLSLSNLHVNVFWFLESHLSACRRGRNQRSKIVPLFDIPSALVVPVVTGSWKYHPSTDRGSSKVTSAGVSCMTS